MAITPELHDLYRRPMSSMCLPLIPPRSDFILIILFNESIHVS